MRSPGAISPLSIASRIAETSCACSGTGSFRLMTKPRAIVDHYLRHGKCCSLAPRGPIQIRCEWRLRMAGWSGIVTLWTQ